MSTIHNCLQLRKGTCESSTKKCESFELKHLNKCSDKTQMINGSSQSHMTWDKIWEVINMVKLWPLKTTTSFQDVKNRCQRFVVPHLSWNFSINQSTCTIPFVSYSHNHYGIVAVAMYRSYHKCLLWLSFKLSVSKWVCE